MTMMASYIIFDYRFIIKYWRYAPPIVDKCYELLEEILCF